MQTTITPDILWNVDALADLNHIIAYLQDKNPSAAERIIDTIDSKVRELVTFPKKYREGRVSGTREMPVHPTYVVVYTENTDNIRILRVLHTSQLWP
jgi:toxin ParE1/3/4